MYCRLPMSISSAPEIYSLKMATVLEGLKGILNLIDYICILVSHKKNMMKDYIKF